MKIINRVLGAALIAIGLAAGIGPVAAATMAEVNGEVITDAHVAQRVKLLALENRRGQRAALDELVNEALMLQEAKRLGIVVSDSEVNEAVVNVARGVRLSPEKLREFLQQNGVTVDALKARLRARLAWSQVTQQAIAPRVQISDVDLEQQAANKATAANSFDYVLKEVVFVLPGGKGSASGRTADANRYRQAFAGCDSAVELSLKYTDAAVVDIGRRHATQMPEAIASELSKLNVGGITKPRVVERGVSMLAVCSKSVAEDLTFIKSEIRAESGGDQLKTEVDKYLAELKSRARIVYN